MPEIKEITYEEVAEIAERIRLNGRRVTSDYVRRRIGRGNHAQISVFLGRWQREKRTNITHPHYKIKSSHVGDSYIRRDTSSIPTSSTQLPDNKSVDRKLPYVKESTSLKRKVEKAFSTERLQKENALVVRLFYALVLVKNQRTRILEVYQGIHNQTLNMRMNREKKIREIKRNNTLKLSLLTSEFNRLRIISARDVYSLRQKLEL